ncbi:MAG TPA: GGDEF domain-containing protein [Chromatiales bacterium]|nr:GGDEF domain-containing protein [Chromatiales bacterium]
MDVTNSTDATGKQNQALASSSCLTSKTRRILSLLEELNRSGAGAVLYQQIERILKESEQTHIVVEQLFRSWLLAFLDIYARQVRPGTAVHVQIKLVQKQLQQPLDLSDLKSLKRYIDMYLMHAARLEALDQESLQQAISPLMSYYTGEAFSLAPETDMETEPDAAPRGTPDAEPYQEPEVDPEAETLVNSRIASTYRKYLSHQQQNAAKVQQILAQRIQETIDANRQFGSMLESVSNGLNEAENIRDVETLRACLLEDVESLSKTHHDLVDKLVETKRYLRMIETDSRKLSDELTRVRMLSMTDELTELPNRRAFLRRLEDEVGRTRRYGFRLALVMLDLDHFKTINDKFGHAGGDAVLRTYASEILTVFRQHDLVARFGGEEFAVLLPNTDEHGAQAALNKVRKQVSETKCFLDDKEITLPTFSAGLTMFVKGDDPESLIQRADDALYTAKRLGRNRVEVKYGLESEMKPVIFKPVQENGNKA